VLVRRSSLALVEGVLRDRALYHFLSGVAGTGDALIEGGGVGWASSTTDRLRFQIPPVGCGIRVVPLSKP